MASVSIITVNLNNHAGLERTIRSVTTQSQLPAEFIVVDGGSTDRSLDLIEVNTSVITKWLSEKDKGIYDAMNKGIRLAAGDYLLFLNSGDTLYSGEVIRHFSAFAAGAHKIIYGNSELTDKQGRSLLVPPSPVPLQHWYRKTLNHQAVFMSRKLFAEYGVYDLRYRICADFALLLKVYMKEPASFAHFPETVCSYDESGFSAAPANYEAMLAEREAILKEHLTEEQLGKMKKAYLASLPFKERLRHYIYDRPVLKRMFMAVRGGTEG